MHLLELLLVPSLKADYRAKLFVVTFCPVADPSQRIDKRPAQLSQGILYSNRLRSGHLPGDKSRRFEIAKRSSKHSLRNVSQATPQHSVAVRLLLQRIYDFHRPFADEKRGSDTQMHLKSVFHFVSAL